MIDDHEHVIDCIKFAPEQARKIIQNADYSKLKLTNDLDRTNNSGDPNESTGDQTRNDESELNEESKHMDESDVRISDDKRMTTKEKVQRLKNDLKKRKAMLRGEIDASTDQKEGEEDDIKIDTTKQEAQRDIVEGELKEFIATGARDKKIRLFEVKSGVCVVTMVGHDNWVTDLVFHPNGKYLISTADDKSIRIWDL